MRREVILKADSSIELGLGNPYRDPGTSPYPSSNTPSKNLHEIWNNETEVVGEYAYAWPPPAASGITSAKAVVGFEPGPTLCRISKVTITAGFDYSQTGPNNWRFPPDVAFGPRGTLVLRKRDLTTYELGTGAATYTILGPPGDDHNVNINTNPDLYKLKALSWEMTSHPEGGNWTLEDIGDLAAGFQWEWDYGAYSRPYDNSAGSRFKIRVPYLTVTLEIEDLGGFVDNVRHGSSLSLRMMRRARNVVRPLTLAEHVTGELGERVYVSHPRGPAVAAGGWGRRRLERRAVLPLRRTIYPETIQVQDEALDLRPLACLGWAAYRIDGPWSPELQGLALLDKGKGFDHTRGQDAWSPRPGDGVLMRVLEDYPNLSREGLAIAAAGDDSVCLRNYDLMQSGWSTVASAGDFAATADATVTHAEEQGYLSSAKLEYGAGGGAGGRERSLGALGAGRLHVRVGLKNSSVPTPATQFGELYLRRGTDYWDEDTRSWVGSPTYIPIPSTEPYGEVVLDAIPATAATYHVGVGRFSSNMGPVTLHAGLVDVQHTDATVAGARPALVTLDAPITRVADSHTMAQVWGRELWAHERGTHVVEVRPWWRAEDLPDAAVKPLLHAQHATAGTGTWDALQFVAVSPGDDLIRFERAIDGESTYQLDCPIDGIDLTRAHVLRAWVRYLGADGWTEYGPYSVEVGYLVTLETDGSVVGQGSVVGRLSSETAVPTARLWLGVGDDGTNKVDGWIRMWETRRSPLHRLECLWKV